MTYIAKPAVRHPGLGANELGLHLRDYEGSISTLCAGCGHDSVTAAIVQAFYELSIPPHRIAKLSGIGCSAKTPAYFVSQAHGFNGVHGRMPALATGANAANRELYYIGISGDGDSLSIGLGQFCHAIRRNVNMLYVMENNGVYGLTKGQFSASADIGSRSKRGVPNQTEPIDPVALALTLGATFVARGFSGDRQQLLPLLKAGLMHKGFAFLDVISPCVTFNDHVGSTKSYLYTRHHGHELAPVDFVPIRSEISASYEKGSYLYTRHHGHELAPVDFVPIRSEISASYEKGSRRDITMHDGSRVRFRKVPEDYDPTDRLSAYERYRTLQSRGEVVTGLLYLNPGGEDMHDDNATTPTPLSELSYEDLCPGSEKMDALMAEFR